MQPYPSPNEIAQKLYHRQKKSDPQDLLALDNIITLPIEPNIRPSGNQSLWFGDKYLSIVRLFGHDAPKESGALVLRDSSHPPTSPQSPFDRRAVNNSPCVLPPTDDFSESIKIVFS